MALTPQRLETWIGQLCRQYTCISYDKEFAKLRSLYGIKTPKRGKARLIGKGEEQMILFHDVTWIKNQPIMDEISFYPLNPERQWSAASLKLIAKAFNDLTKGNILPKDIEKCEDLLIDGDLKKVSLPNYEGKRLAGILTSDQNRGNVVAVAGCYWLPKQLNIAFGFTSENK